MTTATIETTTTAEDTALLSRVDQVSIRTQGCDSCGTSTLDGVPSAKAAYVAQAFMRFDFATGPLYFCGHHGDALQGSAAIKERLAKSQVLITDERELINKAPSVSANKD